MEKRPTAISMNRVWGFLIVGVVLVIWEIAVRFGFIQRLVLPQPSAIFSEGGILLLSGEFYGNVLRTLGRWLASFIVGLVLGLAIGFSAGVSESLENLLSPISSFLRSLPPIALFPVFLILIGPGSLSIVIIGVVYVAIYIFPIVTGSAVSAARTYSELSFIMKLSRLQVIKEILVPAGIVSAIISSRIAAAFLFALVIAGEIIIGGVHGMGHAIYESSERYLLERAYFYIVVTGVLGLIIDSVLRMLQKRFQARNFH